MSGSLLHAIGLENDGLIVSSLDQYQGRAIELATRPYELMRIKEKLVNNRSSYPLFNTDLFVYNLEKSLKQLLER